MKRFLHYNRSCCLVFLLFFAGKVFCQSVSINTDGSTAHNSAILDLKSTSKGLLIPRMTSTERTAISSPAQGLFVFDLTTNSFWYYNGNAWNNLAQQASAPSAVWMLNGNSNTNPATDFIGTSDDKPLVFKIKNQPSGLIDSAFSNTAFGFKSGYSHTTGRYNTALGVQSLFSNTSGNDNTGIGNWALISNTSGNDNTAVGNNALRSNNGDNNTAVGNWALLSNTTGSSNTAFGNNALRSNNGNTNTAVGNWTMLSNVSGSRNTAIGDNALSRDTAGNDNTAVGYWALFQNTKLDNNYTGIENTAVGSGALYANVGGRGNTATGFQSSELNTAGSFNSIYGWGAFRSGKGSNNNAFGASSLSLSNYCANNNAFGTSTLYYNNFGSNNSAFGDRTLFNNLGGNSNSAFGDLASYGNTSGYSNVALGSHALYTNTAGSNLVAIGDSALYNDNYIPGSLYTGLWNTAVGSKALYSCQEGELNTAIGYKALYSYQGHDGENTAIGAETDVRNGGYNAIAIGYQAVASSNEIVLGNDRNDKFFCQAVYNATTSSAPNLYVNSSGQIMRSTSSARYKEEITELEINTSNIYKLRPVSFTSKMDKTRHFGLIAEEVAKTIPELAEYAKEKDVIKGSTSDRLIPDAVQYPMLSVLLLKEVQKHQQTITTQQQTIDDLYKKVEDQQNKIDLLLKRVEALEKK